MDDRERERDREREIMLLPAISEKERVLNSLGSTEYFIYCVAQGAET